MALVAGRAAGDADRARAASARRAWRSRRPGRSRREFRDGAWFVNLAAIDDPEQVPAAIAHGIGLFDGPERPAASAPCPVPRRPSMVLVLDNLEHLLAAADEVAARRARVAGQSRHRHQPRAAPHRRRARGPGRPRWPTRRSRLFIERARAVRPGWEPGDDADVVAEICRLLDDLPLGIELAAARDRDPLADGHPRSAHRPPAVAGRGRPRCARRASGRWRARSPGATTCSIPIASDLLHRLGVFEGGFDLEQVDAVSRSAGGGGDRLDDLLELADQSLIVAAPTRAAGLDSGCCGRSSPSPWTGWPPTAIETDVRRRHAEAFLALATDVSDQLNTSRHGEWLDRMAPEHRQPSVGPALVDRCRRGRASPCAWPRALWRFWQAFGLVAEGRQLAEAALAMPGAPTSGSDRAWALSAAGSLAYWQADSATARRHYQAQIDVAEAAGDEACVADAYFNIGHVAFADRR